MQRLLRARIAAAKMNTDLEMEEAEKEYLQQQKKVVALDNDDIQMAEEKTISEPVGQKFEFKVPEDRPVAPKISLSFISMAPEKPQHINAFVKLKNQTNKDGPLIQFGMKSKETTKPKLSIF